VAGCLHVDYLAADHASTFEHGNLVRGVCVLGMLSQTFAIGLGPHAQHVYLQNARLDAVTACASGLVNQLCVGVTATQMQARYASKIATSAPDSRDLAKAVCCYRVSIDLGTLAREAVGHTECQVTNGGFAKSQLKSHTSKSVSEGSPNLWAVVDHGSIPRAALRGLGTMLLSIGCLGTVARGSIPLGVQHAVHEKLCAIEWPLVASCQRDECAHRTLYAPWQVEVHVSGGSAERRAQEQRLWYCCREDATPLRKGRWRHTVARRAPTLGFDKVTGVAAIEADETGIGPALEAALCILVSLGSSLRAVTVVKTGSSIKLGGSAHTLCRVQARVRRVRDALQELGVPIVCSADENVFEAGLAVWSAADYHSADQHERLQAVRYWSTSKRATKFATWLAHHPVRSALGCHRARICVDCAFPGALSLALIVL
jgi:hypothetical protein